MAAPSDDIYLARNYITILLILMHVFVMSTEKKLPFLHFSTRLNIAFSSLHFTKIFENTKYRDDYPNLITS